MPVHEKCRRCHDNFHGYCEGVRLSTFTEEADLECRFFKELIIKEKKNEWWDDE